jgi:hypothetical protein
MKQFSSIKRHFIGAMATIFIIFSSVSQAQILRDKCFELTDLKARQACLKSAKASRELKKRNNQLPKSNTSTTSGTSSTTNQTTTVETYYPTTSNSFDMESLGTFSKSETKEEPSPTVIKLDLTKDRFNLIQNNFEKIGVGLVPFEVPSEMAHIQKISKIFVSDKAHLGFSSGQIILLESTGQTVILLKDLQYSKDNSGKVFDFIKGFQENVSSSLVELKPFNDYFTAIAGEFEKSAKTNSFPPNMNREKEVPKFKAIFNMLSSNESISTINMEIYLGK